MSMLVRVGLELDLIDLIAHAGIHFCTIIIMAGVAGQVGVLLVNF